jgi:hypothetical protein
MPRSFHALCALVLFASSAFAEGAAGYDRPPDNVLEVMRSPLPPSPYASPTGETILLVSMVEYPPLSRVAEPFVRLAGVRVEPRNHRRHDTPGGYGIPPCIRELSLTDPLVRQIREGCSTAHACSGGKAIAVRGATRRCLRRRRRAP